MAGDPNTHKISEWRSIVTLVTFVLTNIAVIYSFHIPLFIPRPVYRGFWEAVVTCRIVSSEFIDREHVDRPKDGFFVRVRFPMNFVTAPLIADLFLLAISAIGKEEVKGGTVGADNISPLDIMIFFITLAYIAISIDASGLIRWLAFKVLLLGGKVGHKLFFYLYAFFFGLGSFIGNDPIILSGTAFLAYMTRVSKNIRHPKAWIYSQFAVANIASAILVSSNPTNLVLAGAFEIRFIDYTANMVVPVVITAIVLFPFLLYIVFANEKLIPSSIEMHTLPDELAQKQPVNPNIPHARGHVDDQANDSDDREALEEARLSSLQEVMNPFLDRRGAAFGGVIMAATLITVLAINAASAGTSHHQVFWVTLPAAFVMFCWDLACGWLKREETRKIARESRLEFERKERAKREKRAQDERCIPMEEKNNHSEVICQDSIDMNEDLEHERCKLETAPCNRNEDLPPVPQLLVSRAGDSPVLDSIPCRQASILSPGQLEAGQSPVGEGSGSDDRREIASTSSDTIKHDQPAKHQSQSGRKERATLVSLSKKWHQSLQETFPTVVAVLWHLPFALVPFAFAMFVLVQALVTKGWVTVFAHGWDHWVNKTGTIGCIGGMGFLSVILCNFAGTNIGTTILLSRVIQQWPEIHEQDPQKPYISDRQFWATVYSMALGVNYGAFSVAFSASLAGLLWRDILARKHIHVHSLNFAQVNFPIIAVSMAVGCTVLIGEVYIMRDDNKPYKTS